MIHLARHAYKKYKKHKEKEMDRGREPLAADRVYPPGDQDISQNASHSHGSTNSNSIAEGQGATHQPENYVAELEQRGKWIFIPEGAENEQNQTGSVRRDMTDKPVELG
ncbi:hypothetical protein CLAIMM_14987 [Cladophialophora immunda]|nr:hypothetical protein CLAIMM_14987 [Cladophialophora immunda]